MVLPLIVGAIGRVGAAALGRGLMASGIRGAMGRLAMRAELEGVSELQQALSRMNDKLTANEAERIVQRWIDEDFVPEAKSIVPVDTGELQSKIDGKASGYSAELIADTDYALFVEKGTGTGPAQPYMKPAFDRTIDDLTDRLGREITENIKFGGKKK